MIHFEYFTLPNGLKVYVHEDLNTPMAVMNILYEVGSKDEQEDKTGFAHLFEHLMFGGSKYISSYDEPLQKVGGENNAFTSPDITNYYVVLPASNIETAFWLESDRMLSLSFDPHVLEVQQKVVIEEFNERYLNQPYGDVWLKFRPLAYQVHPYKWNTIGKEISHIEQATMDDVRNFFYQFYVPNNAILVVAGNVKIDEIKKLCDKWFAPIPSGKKYIPQLSAEPKQQEARSLEIKGKAPLNAIYKAYHMMERNHPHYYAVDLACSILGRDKSSRLYQTLVKEKKLFNSISSSLTESVDPGLFVIQGKLNDGIEMKKAEQAIEEVLQDFIEKNPISKQELTKVKNQEETSLQFANMELLARAMKLAFCAHLGNPNLINEEQEKIQGVVLGDLHQEVKSILQKTNCSTLYYYNQ